MAGGVPTSSESVEERRRTARCGGRWRRLRSSSPQVLCKGTSRAVRRSFSWAQLGRRWRGSSGRRSTDGGVQGVAVVDWKRRGKEGKGKEGGREADQVPRFAGLVLVPSVRALVTVPSSYSRHGGRRCSAVHEEEKQDEGGGLELQLGWAGRREERGRASLSRWAAASFIISPKKNRKRERNKREKEERKK